jgi:hypothetical protein
MFRARNWANTSGEIRRCAPPPPLVDPICPTGPIRFTPLETGFRMSAVTVGIGMST